MSRRILIAAAVVLVVVGFLINGSLFIVDQTEQMSSRRPRKSSPRTRSGW